MGGDYVSKSPRYLPETAHVLGSSTGDLPLRRAGRFGNHDYSNDAPRMERLLAGHGVRVLRNEPVRVPWFTALDCE
ncbi:MAG: hypothetical protein R2853_14290 [Thermomicrobiales bacterium]